MASGEVEDALKMASGEVEDSLVKKGNNCNGKKKLPLTYARPKGRTMILADCTFILSTRAIFDQTGDCLVM